MELNIRQAQNGDIEALSGLYKQAVEWMNSIGEPMWSFETVAWENLNKIYDISEFYVGCVGDKVVCAMSLPTYDPHYWEDIRENTSIFVHKVVVLREFSGQGFTQKMLDYAVQKTRDCGYKTLRIDARVLRPKLRKIYENYGFNFVKTAVIDNSFEVALYELEV